MTWRKTPKQVCPKDGFELYPESFQGCVVYRSDGNRNRYRARCRSCGMEYALFGKTWLTSKLQGGASNA